MRFHDGYSQSTMIRCLSATCFCSIACELQAVCLLLCACVEFFGTRDSASTRRHSVALGIPKDRPAYLHTLSLCPEQNFSIDFYLTLQMKVVRKRKSCYCICLFILTSFQRKESGYPIKDFALRPGTNHTFLLPQARSILTLRLLQGPCQDWNHGWRAPVEI